MLGVSEIKVQFANHLIYAQTCMCLDTDLCNSERSKLTAECSVLSFMLLQKPLFSKTNVFTWNSRSFFPSVCVWKVLTEGQRPLPRTKTPLSCLPHTLVSDLYSSPWGRPRKLQCLLQKDFWQRCWLVVWWVLQMSVQKFTTLSAISKQPSGYWPHRCKESITID